jgi:hypothetical protein
MVQAFSPLFSRIGTPCNNWVVAMLSIRLDPQTEGNIDELEDRYLAEARLEEHRPSLTSKQVRDELGLEI